MKEMQTIRIALCENDEKDLEALIMGVIYLSGNVAGSYDIMMLTNNIC